MVLYKRAEINGVSVYSRQDLMPGFGLRVIFGIR